jgi:hypothetical protein
VNNERLLKLKIDILDMASPLANPRLLKCLLKVGGV